MYKSLALIVTAVAGVAFAQLPSCANSCIQLPAECPNPLPSCICKQSSWINSVACCVYASCTSQTEITEVITYANSICNPEGVTLPTSADNCPSNSTSASSSSSVSSSASSSSLPASGSVSSSSVTGSTSIASAGSSIASSLSASAASASAAATSAALGNRFGAADAAGFVGAFMGVAVLF